MLSPSYSVFAQCEKPIGVWAQHLSARVWISCRRIFVWNLFYECYLKSKKTNCKFGLFSRTQIFEKRYFKIMLVL
ncbi:hypothetical protein AB6A40_001010 [Gnathostoma spinigerum]|uniref:Uncharacterized protein n=1 Tax=Gnathostoma spinigerum TaxID=75299 RepID=A0ABD6E4H2_9BILA